ncbi:MAG: alpha/beta fold hydrolase [Candidatus Omnitrophica bacterium]|nr:alpha/beta fold hydrolase [Candidatus Omnitrophota bacterium]
MYKLKKIFITFTVTLLACTVLSQSKILSAEVDFLKYDNEKVQLDIYNPGKSYCPVVILIHGAAGIEGDRAIRYKRFATDLMKKGIIAINVHYFDSSKRSWLKTIAKTIDYIKNIHNANPRKIGLIGYSLGGTIALKVASLDNRIKLLVINSGYMPRNFTKKDAVNLPETYVLAGTKDNAINTLYQLQRWFKEFNKPFTAKINKGYGHSIPLAMFWDNWETIVSFVADRFR